MPTQNKLKSGRSGKTMPGYRCAAAVAGLFPLFVMSIRSYGAAKSWDGGTSGTGSAWATTTNWAPDGNPTLSDDVTFRSITPGAVPTAMSLSGANTICQSLTFLNNFNVSNTSLVQNNSGTGTSSIIRLYANTSGILIDFQPTSGSFTIQNGTATTVTQTLNTQIHNSGTISVASGGLLSITGPFNNSTGTTPTANPVVTKTGGGKFVLGGGSASTFAGSYVLNGGTLSINSGSSLGAAPGSPTTNITFTGDSTFESTGSGVLINANRSIVINSGVSATFDPTSLSLTGNSSISGGGNLIKSGTGVFNLAGTNSYGGTTTINSGTLQVGNAGTSGTLGSGNVINNATLRFNRTDAFTINNNISGSGAVVQNGTGTTTLSGTGTYTGNTTVNAGTLNITGSIANNSHTKVFVADDADGTFGTSDDVRIIRSVSLSGSYANIGSTELSGLASFADLVQGANSSGSDNSVSMQWRVRSLTETNGSSPPLPPYTSQLLSDVVHLTGMVNSGGTSGQTDSFAMEMKYDDTSLVNESQLASDANIFMVWLDTSGTPQWRIATAGNFGTGSTVVTNYQGSWSSFAAANSINDGNVANYLGSWGVDTTSNKVWAVLNHNSDFSVVPEPASLTLLGAGTLSIVSRRRRRLV